MSSDSRGTWINQVLVDDVAVIKSSTELGPGSYSPEPVQGKISTIKFDRLWTTSPEKRKPYGLNYKLPESLRGSKGDPYESPKLTGTLNIGGKRSNSVNWSEFAPHQPIIDAIYHDGKMRTREGMIRYSDQDRYKIKTALPDYNVKYESQQIRSKIYNGKFPKLKRPEVFPVNELYEPHLKITEDRPWRANSADSALAFPQQRGLNTLKYDTITKCNLPKGPLKDINPMEINRCIKANFFSHGYKHRLSSQMS